MQLASENEQLQNARKSNAGKTTAIAIFNNIRNVLNPAIERINNKITAIQTGLNDFTMAELTVKEASLLESNAGAMRAATSGMSTSKVTSNVNSLSNNAAAISNMNMLMDEG